MCFGICLKISKIVHLFYKAIKNNQTHLLTAINRQTMAFTKRSGRQSTQCPHCDQNPCECEALQCGKMFVGVTKNVHEDDPPKAKHKAAYWYYVHFKHGTLRKGNIVVIPDCIKELSALNTLISDPNGEYMGHKNYSQNVSLEYYARRLAIISSRFDI